MASYEINLMLKHIDKTANSIQGYIFLHDPKDTSSIIDEVTELLAISNLVTKDFNMINISMIISKDEIIDFTLYSDKNQILNEEDLCNLIIPEEMTTH